MWRPRKEGTGEKTGKMITKPREGRGGSVFLPARYWAFFRGRRAPFWGGWASFFSVVCLAVVGSPPLPIDALLPPAVGPLWRPGFFAGPVARRSHGPGCAAVSLTGAIQWCSL